MNKITINFQKNKGLVPVVIQDWKSNEVYMLGFMNKKSFDKTSETNFIHFYSRSKKRLWMKGEESGNKLKVIEILADCDQDTLLIKVELIGNCVCHTGKKSCFHYQLTKSKK